MKKLICLIFSIIIVSMFSVVSASAEKLLYAAVVEGSLALQLSPDEESLKITEVPGCAELRLIKTEGTWGLVVFANKCGWINTSFTRASYEEAAEATGYDSLKNVETNSSKEKVGLYTLPSDKRKTGSVEKYSVPNGMILKITRETSDGWGLVSMGKEFLWVKLKDTKPYITEAEQAVSEYELYYVYALSENGGGVKLYSEPGESAVLATIADCVKLTVRKTENNYAYVSYNGINGWVSLDDTTLSFSNAQANAGKAINEEYEISGETASSSVDIFNVPSNKIKDGAVVIGNINSGAQVFVRRCTADGWMLINHNGIIGWISPGSAVLKKNDNLNSVTPLKERTKGYVATGKENGLAVYPLYDSTAVVARIPECTEVEVIAEKDGKQYVYCDYAAGWTVPGSLTDSYGKALETNISNKRWKYRALEDTALMSLPMEDYLCNNQKLATVKADAKLEIIRIVTTGNTKWGLTEADGKTGWINLGKASRLYSPLEIILFVLSLLCIVSVIIIAVRFIVRKIKKSREKRSQKTPQDTDAPQEENTEEIGNGAEK